MEEEAGDEYCLCLTQRKYDHVSGGRAISFCSELRLCLPTVSTGGGVFKEKKKTQLN